MELRIFIDLIGIEFIGPNNSTVFEDFQICRYDGFVLDNKIFDSYVLEQIGNINAMRFCDKPYLWSVLELDQPIELSAFSRRIQSNISHMLSLFWLLKDNSVNSLNTYTYIPEDKQNPLFSRSNAFHYSNCIGEFSDTTFSTDDFIFAETLFKKLLTLIGTVSDENIQPKNITSVIVPPRFNYTPYNSNNRISRAISFLSMARSQSFLPLKVSFYTAILECLFTTDNQEVSHKTAERTAFYLGDENKFETYEIIKTAYGLRSKYFHGQTLDKKVANLEKQKDLSIAVDEILRRILNKVIVDDFNIFTNEGAHAKYMNSIIFSNGAKL